jgi:hypothetical protein
MTDCRFGHPCTSFDIQAIYSLPTAIAAGCDPNPPGTLTFPGCSD